ncbi:ankyrin, partial [Choiromyces venosus 120613-1]
INTLLSSDYFPVNAVDTSGQTPLFIAAGGNPMAVKYLLGHSADANTVTGALETPLIRASQHGQAVIVRMLLAKEKTDVNKRDLLGLSALYWAASMGCVKATAALLEDPRQVLGRYFGESNTPLRVARNKGHGEIVKMLERLDLEWRDGLPP